MLCMARIGRVDMPRQVESESVKVEVRCIVMHQIQPEGVHSGCSKGRKAETCTSSSGSACMSCDEPDLLLTHNA